MQPVNNPVTARLPRVEAQMLGIANGNGYPNETLDCISNVSSTVYNRAYSSCDNLMSFLLETADTYNLPLRRIVLDGIYDRIQDGYLEHLAELNNCTTIECLEEIMGSVEWGFNLTQILLIDENNFLLDAPTIFVSSTSGEVSDIILELGSDLITARQDMQACCTCDCECPYED